MVRDAAKPLAGCQALTPADVLLMLQPSFWWSPKASHFLCLRQSAVVALLALGGIGVESQQRLQASEIDPAKRRMIVRKFSDEWLIPMTKIAAHVVNRYLQERAKISSASQALFLRDDGRAASAGTLWRPIFRANGLLGNEIPLTTLLANFFWQNIEGYQMPEVCRAFIGRKYPGELHPPQATIKQMAEMLDATNVMGDDLRVFDSTMYAQARIAAIGGSKLPNCLWDLGRSGRGGFKRKDTLPDDHPIVVRLTALNLQPHNRGAKQRDPVFKELIAEIDALILANKMTAAQAAKLFRMKPKSFGERRRNWRKGGARKKPWRSQARPRAQIKRKEMSALASLKNAKWPALPAKKAQFRQQMIDLYFPDIAALIKGRNLKQSKAAELFKTISPVIGDLLADLDAGCPLVVLRPTDPIERNRAKEAIFVALANREAGETIAGMARRIWRETKLKLPADFIRWTVSNSARPKPRRESKRSQVSRSPVRKRRQKFGLTPTALERICSIDQGDGKTLKSLASEWRCSAGAARDCVKQIARAGYLDRRRKPRSASTWVLNAAGVAIREEMIRYEMQLSGR